MQIHRAIESKSAVTPAVGRAVKTGLKRMRKLALEGKLKPTNQTDQSDVQQLFPLLSAKTATWFADHEETVDGRKIEYRLVVGSGQTAPDEPDQKPEARAHAILFINHPEWTARYYAKPDRQEGFGLHNDQKWHEVEPAQERAVRDILDTLADETRLSLPVTLEARDIDQKRKGFRKKQRNAETTAQAERRRIAQWLKHEAERE